MWPDKETNIDYLNFGYIVDLIVEIAICKIERGHENAEIEGIGHCFARIEKHLTTSTILVHSRGRI